jgi:outer membrane protein assembly factor BamB
MILRILRFLAAAMLLIGSVGPVYGAPRSNGYLWRASTGGRIRGRPVSTRDGVVCLLSEDRHLYALDEYTGRRIRRTYLGGRVWDSLCIGVDGTVYTVLKDGDLVAVGRAGGVAWRFKAKGLPVGNPAAVADGTI